jgi:mannose-6-phosphate isomerase
LRGPADDGSARQSVFPDEAAPFFRAERLRDGAALDAAVSVLVVTQGRGVLATDGARTSLAAGDTIVVPCAAGPGEITGEVEAIRCRPPDPAADQDVPRPAI